MYMFMTFASPHLGFMYSSSKIVSAGLWVLRKWRKSMCLKQLTMTDDKDLRQTFIYNLSKTSCLDNFHKVIFAGSCQDTYSPYDSARIEISPKTSNDMKGCIYTEMVTNILESLRCESVVRVDVNFAIRKKSVDSIIGRTAHIEFIENPTAIRMLVERYIN
jgi:hypothetical protein